MTEKSPLGIGYTKIMHDFTEYDASFRDDIEHLIQHAKSRLPIRIGERDNRAIIRHKLPLEGVKTIFTEKAPLIDIFNNALKIRNIVEWNGWGSDTAFPDVREHSEAGEPFGQCLVTSRFAKDYFPGSKLTEVKVRHYSGEVVGPHVILTIPRADGKNMALDLTPDQAFAAGEIPHPAKALNPYLKVNVVPFDNDKCPYIFVRYQEDDELETKRSKPLDHTRLLKDKVAFALGLPAANNLEKFAHLIEPDEFRPEIDMFLSRQIAQYNGGDQNLNFTIQNAAITQEELRPQPQWLWETAGLAGAKRVVIYHHGYVQEFLHFDGESIYINNLCGIRPPDDILEYGAQFIEDNKTRVVAGRPLIVQHVETKQWTGPVFVQ